MMRQRLELDDLAFFRKFGSLPDFRRRGTEPELLDAERVIVLIRSGRRFDLIRNGAMEAPPFDFFSVSVDRGSTD
jgi:hypothetical protein